MRRAREGELLENAERRIRILARAAELCVFSFEAEPGYDGPPPHVHRQHVDAFYVLEGELSFELEGQQVDAPAGTFVAAPPASSIPSGTRPTRPSASSTSMRPGCASTSTCAGWTRARTTVDFTSRSTSMRWR